MPAKLGEKLLRCRTRYGLSQSAVASAAGMSRSYLSELETQRLDNPLQTNCMCWHACSVST